MKNILIIFILLLVTGCKDKVLNDTNRSNVGKQYTASQLPSTKLIPTNKFKKLVGEEIDGLKREQISSGYSGLNSVEFYYANDNKKLVISILDGAGVEGSKNIALIKPSIDANLDIENENGYIKSTFIEGIKAVQEEIKTKNETIGKLTLIVNGRFVLTLSGTNISMDDIMDIVRKEEIIGKLQVLSN